MPYYMVIRRKEGESIGTVLWDGEAVNPEEAVIKASEQAIEPELLRMGDLGAESKVNLAETIMGHIEKSERSTSESGRSTSVFEVVTGPEGNAAQYKMDELDFSSTQN